MHNTITGPLINLIKKFLKDGDLSKARSVAQHLTAKHPDVLEGWLFLAGLSPPDERMAYLAKASEIAPDDPRLQKAIDWEAKHASDVTPQSTQKPMLPPGFPPQTVSMPQISPTGQTSWLTRISQNGFFRGFVHMGKKALLIALTIILGVFVTISIMNRPVRTGIGTEPPQLDTLMEKYVQRSTDQYSRENQHLSSEEWNEFRTELIRKSGIELPKFQRHLRWTINALTFDWGRIRVGEYNPFGGFFRPQQGMSLNDIILEFLPNTLLLVCTAYLLVFLLGLPLALTMSRNYGKWYDKVFSFFATLSSIPSWVYGIILITIFALELRLLPTGRMVGNMPPETTWGYIFVVGRHMILPVTAIFLSIFFNLVYSWRTFFTTFSSEDYVELGKAIGLSNRKLQKDYILKPSLPYVITSFSLMFVTFWQMTLALEVVFDWPGLGWLYVVRGLPNLWGETVYPGDLVISISLVVMFAYLMGSIVLILDLVYVIVDPRIRLSKGSQNLHLRKRTRQPLHALKGWFQSKNKLSRVPDLKETNHNRDHYTPQTKADGSMPTLVKFQFWKWLKRASAEVVRYPSAIIGFIIIGLLILGSLYAVIFLPYEKIGDDWSRSSFVGQPQTPKLARPAWTNLFIKGNYLSTLKLNSAEGDAEYEFIPLNGDTNQVILTFNFDYDYAAFPSEVFLYLSSTFESKRGFAEIFWRTPDGRELE